MGRLQMTVGYFNPVEKLDTSPRVSDEVKYTTCYMCACRCGIKVHMLDGNIRYIEGNKNHPINKGALCAKGAAGIMNHYSPARLTKPLKRVGDRGKGEFQEIEWEEALSLASNWLTDIRSTDPRKLAFFTGRDQSEAFTGWWATQFGTPNYAAHGGFCSVNMATAGIYTIGGSFWEFGEPDWPLAKYFLLFGVAEDHNSNPIKAGLSKLKANGAKFVSVNPIKTGYSAVADEWLGIRPGTDGIFVLSLVHELLKADRIDLDYIVRYTNLPWLVIQDPGNPDDGLFARGEDGEPLCWDGAKGEIASALLADITPSLSGDRRLPDGRTAIPAFALMADHAASRQHHRAGGCGARNQYPRRDHSPHRGGARRNSLRTGNRNRPAVDGLGGTASRDDQGPPRRHACDARHFGPFERLSHLPRHPSAANSLGQHRLPGRLPLQTTLPQDRAAAAETHWKSRPGSARHAHVGPTARVSRGARGFAG